MAVVSVKRGRDPYQTAKATLKLLLEVGVEFPKVSGLKPNVLSTDIQDSRNTDCRVVEAVADILLEEGGLKPACFEGATHGAPPDTLKAFRNFGYYSVKSISRFIDLNLDEPGAWFEAVSLGLGYGVELGIARSVLEGPVASVAKFKTHDVLGLTLTLKNMMGSICQARKVGNREVLASGWISKGYMHGWGPKRPNELPREVNIGPSRTALAKNLALLARVCTPALAVIDGVTAMEGNGPVHGAPVNLGLVIAGTDPVACDTVACQITGFNPVETGYIYAAGRLGLGEYRLEGIEVVGEKIDEARRALRPHRLYRFSKFKAEEAERLVEELRQSALKASDR